MMKLKATLYDSEGKEIEMPENHMLVWNETGRMTIPIEDVGAKIIYKPCNDETQCSPKIFEDYWVSDHREVKKKRKNGRKKNSRATDLGASQ